MTPEEYESRKEELKEQYKLLDDHMDTLGFTPYQDGSGDFGKRRFIKDKDVYEVWILDMEPDYWLGDYPDGQFLGRRRGLKKDMWLNTTEDIDKFISDSSNVNYTLK